jgi:restriction system protein
VTTDRPAWTVRTGKHGERDDWALTGGRVGGGWNEVPDLSRISSKQEMEALVSEVYGTDKPGQVSTNTSQLWSLRSRIEVGDLMVLPLKTRTLSF